MSRIMRNLDALLSLCTEFLGMVLVVLSVQRCGSSGQRAIYVLGQSLITTR